MSKANEPKKTGWPITQSRADGKPDVKPSRTDAVEASDKKSRENAKDKQPENEML